MQAVDEQHPENRCWVCDSTAAEKWKDGNGPARLDPNDLKITDDRYGVTLGLWRCGACGFIYSDREEMGDLVALYGALVDDDYDGSRDTRALQMDWILDLAERSHPGAGTGLDIGAASGLLVRKGLDRGLEMAGVEPSASLVEVARRSNDVELVHGVYPHPDLSGRTFDLVFLVDVIEHVGDPVGLLRAAGAALAPGGVAIVVTPDIGSRTARMMGERWWHLRLAHVGYFDSASFGEAARRAGLVVNSEVRAKWFFRVAYLAARLEQYLPVGWINRLAARTPVTRWLYERAIPLNLHDSTVFVLKGADA
jgi:SAM-dependent methyltransferase